MAIHEATAAFLKQLGEGAEGEVSEPSVSHVRASMKELADLYGVGPELHVVENHEISPPGAIFRVRVLIPTPSPKGIMIYYHGGGFVLGNIDEYDTLGREIAQMTNLTVVLVDYRLAPEHVFPAAVDDAWEALQWVRTREFPGSGGPVVLAGDSAGGNLSIVTALRARDVELPVDATVLLYPMTDVDMTRPSYLEPESQLFLTTADVEWLLGLYFDGDDSADWRLSPVRASNLRDFPKTALAIAEHDPLRDEGLAFGERLRRDGVPVDERVFERQLHGFFQLKNVLPSSKEAIGWIATFIEEVEQEWD